MIVVCDLRLWRPVPRGDLTKPVKPDVRAPSLTGDSGYEFSGRSLEELATVKPRLQSVAHRALRISKRDFAVTEGIRTIETQRKYVATGRSQTLKSKHLTGDAIDLMAYFGGQGSWDMSHYLLIANAMVYAADAEGVGIRWGGAWHVPDIRVCADKKDAGATMMELYRQLRKRQGRKVFIDAVHFELA